MPTPFATVCVVGLGTAGRALTAMLGRSGRRVIGVGAQPNNLAHHELDVLRDIDRLAEADQQPRQAGLDLAFTTDITACRNADLVIEAVPERVATKVALFRAIHEVCPARTVFATTTAGLSVTEIASHSGRMARVAGLHPGNPGDLAATRAMEIVHTPVTDASIRTQLVALTADLGVTGVPVADRPGLLGAGLFLSYLNSAATMCEQGYATRDDIDTAMTLGCGMAIGPLAHIDAIGVDVLLDSLTALAARSGDRGHEPAPVLARMAAAGLLGRKTGNGFYRYQSTEDELAGQHRSAGPMSRRRVDRIGVVGTGTMATGIAQACARAGYPTTVLARSTTRAGAAMASIDCSLTDDVRMGRLSDADADTAMRLLAPTTEPLALGECDLVVEAVVEDLAVKREVFAELDRCTRQDTVLATTTSSLPVLACASATNRPENVVGMHFFHPVGAMRLVEVTRTVLTSDDVAATAMHLVSTLGKHAVSCGDRTGFIVNALLFPYLNRAVDLIRNRHVRPDEIDTVMSAGYGFPMGPFQLLDAIGLDVSLAIQERLYDTFADPELKPAAYLGDLVLGGHLGRKTGRGFRVYATA